MDEQEKVDTVTPCMHVYKTKNKYDGYLDTLKFIIVVILDLQNK